MKKLFLTICFIAAAFNARADVIEVNNAAELQQRRQDTPPIAITDDRIPDGSDQNAVAAFIKERLQSKKVIIDSFDENVAIPSPLLHEAMEKTANLCTVTTREVQKILHVGYPLAEQIRCELCKIKSKTTG